MNKTTLSLAFGATIFAMSCTNSPQEKSPESNSSKGMEQQVANLRQKAVQFFGPLPKEALKDTEPLDSAQVILGKTLYHDNILSKDFTQSCNTCHNLENYGVDNQSFSTGNDGELGGRNSPSTYNAALHIAQFWDGREPDVEAQAGGPILNPIEMAMPSKKAVIERLEETDQYPKLFGEAFPEDPSITFDHLKTAIGAFERTLITPTAFDQYIQGDDEAISEEAQEGLALFMETGCNSCHNGPTIGGTNFQKFGVFEPYWKYTKSEKIDSGMYLNSKAKADLYKFKTASLLNVAKTQPYFHDGSVNDLNDAIKIMAKIQRNKDLTDEEVEKIAAFLKTLTMLK